VSLSVRGVPLSLLAVECLPELPRVLAGSYLSCSVEPSCRQRQIQALVTLVVGPLVVTAIDR